MPSGPEEEEEIAFKVLCQAYALYFLRSSDTTIMATDSVCEYGNHVILRIHITPNLLLQRISSLIECAEFQKRHIALTALFNPTCNYLICQSLVCCW